MGSRYVSKEDALANPLRQQLVDVVEAQPGITMRQLAQRLDCQPSTILWHAAKLGKAGLLRSERVGAVRVFYLAAGGQAQRLRSLETAFLQHDVARQIRDVVQGQPGISFRLLSQTLSANTATLRWHARRLVQGGLLCLGRGPGRSIVFYPGAQPGTPCTGARPAERVATALRPERAAAC